MALKRNEVIKIAKNLVMTLSKKITVRAAYLFGSYAKGNPGEFSDIDIAIVSPQFKGIRFYDIKMLIPLLRGYSNLIEIHPFKTTEFNKKNFFIREIISNGIKLR